MSSLLNTLDMSLDDLISKNKQQQKQVRSSRGGGKSGSGPQRRNQARRRGRSQAQPYARRVSGVDGDS